VEFLRRMLRVFQAYSPLQFAVWSVVVISHTESSVIAEKSHVALYIYIWHRLSRQCDVSHYHEWDFLWARSLTRERHIRLPIWPRKLLMGGWPDLRWSVGFVLLRSHAQLYCRVARGSSVCFLTRQRLHVKWVRCCFGSDRLCIVYTAHVGIAIMKLSIVSLLCLGIRVSSVEWRAQSDILFIISLKVN